MDEIGTKGVGHEARHPVPERLSQSTERLAISSVIPFTALL
jgi:hypothetical protein